MTSKPPETTKGWGDGDVPQQKTLETVWLSMSTYGNATQTYLD